MKNLKEEIKRIKDLFTESRLYGNILNESTNPDTNNDGKINKTEFEASGEEIDGDEAKLFLKGLGFEKIERDYSSNASAADMCLKSPIIKTTIRKSENKIGSTDIKNYNPIVNANSGVCYFSMIGPSVIDYPIKKITFWNDKRITFYISIDTPIDFTNNAEFEKSMPNLSSTSVLKRGVVGFGKFLTTKKIKYLRYFADFNPTTWTYDSVEFGGFYDEMLKRTAKPIENTIIDDFLYNPGGSSIDVDINQILTNSSYGDVGLTGAVDNLLDKMKV